MTAQTCLISSVHDWKNIIIESAWSNYFWDHLASFWLARSTAAVYANIIQKDWTVSAAENFTMTCLGDQLRQRTHTPAEV